MVTNKLEYINLYDLFSREQTEFQSIVIEELDDRVFYHDKLDFALIAAFRLTFILERIDLSFYSDEPKYSRYQAWMDDLIYNLGLLPEYTFINITC